MTTITLLGLEHSVYTRIARLALEEKNVDYVLEETDIFADDGPPASYLEKQPFGMIPCLVHDGFTLYETAAITRYIDEGFDGKALQPRDPAQRATMNQVINVLDAYAYRPMVWDVYVQRIELPKYGDVADEAVISAALESMETVLDQLQSWLGQGRFLAGSTLTLADLHGLPMLDCFDRAPDGNRLLSRYPSILKWMDRMSRRSSARIVMGEPR